MKIRLAVSDERADELRALLEAHGIEVDDDADLILTEKSTRVRHLPARSLDRSERVYVPTDGIIFIESYGHDVYIHSDGGSAVTSDPLYQLEYLLDPVRFCRVSASVIVSRTHIREIRPALSRKFTLVMSDGNLVDVTRSYYNTFKEQFGL